MFNNFPLESDDPAAKAGLIEALVNAAPDAVMLFDAAGTVLAANPAAEKMFGYASGGMNGLKAETFVPQRFRTGHVGLRSDYVAARESRQIGAGRTVTGVRADGSELELEFRLSRFAHDGAQYVMVAIRDASELLEMLADLGADKKVLEQAVQQRTRELEAARDAALNAQRAESRFLSNMSHEMRNPLNAIVGLLQHIVEESAAESEIRDSATLALGAGKHMSRIINDILTVKKIAEGQERANPTTVDMHRFADDAEGIARSITAEKGLEYVYRADRDAMPRFLVVDRAKMTQIAYNLFSNAVKFTESGTISLDASYADGHLKFEIQDNGIGMSAEELKKLFRRFTQADDSISKRFGGTGLGLSITRELVELMGGTITVSSEPGQGTTFSVSLPAPVDEELEANWREGLLPDATKADTGPDLSDLRILCVDDSTINLKVLSRPLTKAGATVTTADSGKDALALIRAGDFDLVLTDISMPEMNGEQLMHEITQWKLTLPVVAVTGNVHEDDVARYLDSGFKAVLAKPLDPANLYATVRRVLSNAERSTRA